MLDKNGLKSYSAEVPPSPYAQAIGAAVRAAREQESVSQDELAQMLTIDAGLSWRQSTVAKVEQGTRSLAAEELWAISLALGVPFDAILPHGSMRNAQRAAREQTGTTAAARRGSKQRFDQWSAIAETTTSAARTLGLPVDKVESFAVDLWGRSYYAERERRLRARRKADPKFDKIRDSEIRRQVSREMVMELRAKWEER